MHNFCFYAHDFEFRSICNAHEEKDKLSDKQIEEQNIFKSKKKNILQ